MPPLRNLDSGMETALPNSATGMGRRIPSCSDVLIDILLGSNNLD